MSKSFFIENIHSFYFIFAFSTTILLLTGKMLYSNAYYLIPSMIFLMGFVLNYFYLKGLSEDLSNAFNALSVIIYSASFLVAGLIWGFGLNSLLLTPLTLALRTMLVFATVAFTESSRILLIVKTRLQSHPALATVASAFTLAIIYAYVFEGPPSSLNWFIKYLALSSYSTALSIIAWRYGFKTLLLNALTYAILFYLFPIIPASTSLLTSVLSLALQTILLSGSLYALAKPASASLWNHARKSYSKTLSIMFIILSILLPGSFLLGVRVLAVSSGSMTPSLNVGDVVVSIPASPGELKAGDIIVFSGGSSIIVHRIIEPAGNDCFITKGDANESPDPIWACGSSIVGKVVVVVPFIGLPTTILLGFLRSFSSLVSLVIALLSLVYVFYVVKGVVLF